MDNKFDNILFDKEYRNLIGRSFQNILILFLILLLTFLSLGHVVGSYKTLQVRMNNPFSNWIQLPKGIKPVEKEKSEEIKNDFNSIKQLRDSFLLDTIVVYTFDQLDLLSRDLQNIKSFSARTIDEDDRLWEVIRQRKIYKENVQFETHFEAIVVKAEMLEDLGFDPFKPPKTLLMRIEVNEGETFVKLPIYLVVDELPDKADLLFSYRLNNCKFIGSIVEQKTNQNNFSLCFDKVIEPKRIEAFMLEYFSSNQLGESPFLTSDTIHFKEFFVAKYYLEKGLNFSQIAKFGKVIRDSIPSALLISQIYCPANLRPDEQVYAFYFKNLEKVEEFSRFAKSNYSLTFPMEKIESKKNFSLISKLTKLLIGFLFFLSLSSIILFLYNLIKSHLDKIKAELGTLKAFGLNDQKIIKLYSRIVLKFYLIGSLITFCVVSIYHFIINASNNAGLIEWPFDLYDYRVLVFWTMSVAILLVFVRIFLNKFLNHAPGDLIYNRV